MRQRKRISFVTADGSSSAAGKEIVFISYRHSDKVYLKKVEEAFVEHTNFALWHDDNLSVGETFDQEIMDAISISNIFVAIITPNYFDEYSYTYKTEIPLAKQYGLIPVAIICEKISKEKLEILKEWTEYVYDLDNIAFDQISQGDLSEGKETAELRRCLKRINCSYITVSEIETLMNYENIHDRIDDMIYERYAKLLDICGLADSDKQNGKAQNEY